MTNKDNHIWIAIVVVVVIILAFIYISNSNKSQNSVTCNSPYIKVGSSCCLDQNSNDICDDDETQKQQKSYAAIDNFYGELRWVNLMDITASSKGSVPERCPNGRNEGDIRLEFKLKDLTYSTPYSCKTDLIEGEDIYLWSGEHAGDWGINENNGYSIDGQVAFSQYLKEQHTVRVCCSPLENKNQEICKSFILPPYC